MSSEKKRAADTGDESSLTSSLSRSSRKGKDSKAPKKQRGDAARATAGTAASDEDVTLGAVGALPDPGLGLTEYGMDSTVYRAYDDYMDEMQSAMLARAEQLDELKREIDEKQRLVDTLRDQLAALTDKTTTGETKLKETLENLDKTVAELEGVQKELADANAERIEKSREVSTLTAKVEGLEAELRAKSVQVEERATTLADMQAQLERSTAQNSDLQDQNSRLTRENSTLDQTRAALLASISKTLTYLNNWPTMNADAAESTVERVVLIAKPSDVWNKTSTEIYASPTISPKNIIERNVKEYAPVKTILADSEKEMQVATDLVETLKDDPTTATLRAQLETYAAKLQSLRDLVEFQVNALSTQLAKLAFETITDIKTREQAVSQYLRLYNQPLEGADVEIAKQLQTRFNLNVNPEAVAGGRLKVRTPAAKFPFYDDDEE